MYKVQLNVTAFTELFARLVYRLQCSWFVYAPFLTFQGFIGIRLLAKQIQRKAYIIASFLCSHANPARSTLF